MFGLRSLALLAAVAAAAVIALAARDSASAAPTISDLRAQVARIQAEVAGIDEQVGQAAEAYNGAVYQLGLINDRITKNRAAIKRATERLVTTQTELGRRLREQYMQPEPTPLQLLLTTRSASAAAEGAAALERAATRDTQVIRAVRELRVELARRAKELAEDQAAAKDEVEERARQRAAVEQLLARRRAVLDGAQGALARELEAEARREAARRREANSRAQALLAQQTTEPSSGASSGSTPTASTPAPTVSSGSSGRNAAAVQVAMRYLGVPYVWGGASPSGFDCSGLAMYAYAQVGVSMAHYTGAIYSAFPKVSYNDLQTGDLVFFSGLGHMGIYIGGGQMVHAPHTGDVVRVSPIAGRSFVGAVRP